LGQLPQNGHGTGGQHLDQIVLIAIAGASRHQKAVESSALGLEAGHLLAIDVHLREASYNPVQLRRIAIVQGDGGLWGSS